MSHLWKVEFEVKYSGIGEWMGDETVHVISNCDGLKAIRKAENVVMKREFTDGDGSVRHVTNCRVVVLSQLQEIDA